MPTPLTTKYSSSPLLKKKTELRISLNYMGLWEAKGDKFKIPQPNATLIFDQSLNSKANILDKTFTNLTLKLHKRPSMFLILVYLAQLRMAFSV